MTVFFKQKTDNSMSVVREVAGAETELFNYGASGTMGIPIGSEIIGDAAGASYTSSGSYQPVGVDLNLGAAAGSGDGGDPDFLAPIMGNVIGANMTTDANYIGGVIGHYNVTGTNASTYPVGAVLAGIGDTTTTADGAVVAYIDGDSGVTTAGAAFKVMSNNSNASSGFEYGLDLQDAAHDGYAAVDKDFYTKAPIRIVNNVAVIVGAGAPVDGTTGDNVAGPGSLYIDITNTNLYINSGTITDGVWKLFTRAA